MATWDDVDATARVELQELLTETWTDRAPKREVKAFLAARPSS